MPAPHQDPLETLRTSGQEDETGPSEESQAKDHEYDTNVKEYPVERIVAHRLTKGHVQYRVRWYGFDATEDTWEPREHIPDLFIVL